MLLFSLTTVMTPVRGYSLERLSASPFMPAEKEGKKKNTTVAWWQIYYSLGQISLWWQLGIKLLLPGWVRRGSEEQFLFYQCLFQVLILNTQCYIFSQIIFLYHLIVYEWCDSNCCAESSILTSLKKTPKKKKKVKWGENRIENWALLMWDLSAITLHCFCWKYLIKPILMCMKKHPVHK